MRTGRAALGPDNAGSGLELRSLRVTYGAGPRSLTAVDGIDLSVPAGRTVALVGESGCGKSTIAKAIVGLAPVTGGQVLLDGVDVGSERARRANRFRQRVQMVFQDPYSSLNPRMTVGDALDEALALHTPLQKAGRRNRIAELLDMVTMPSAAADKYPAEFSGGQRQRIAIARALATDPEVVIADEITSALDVSVQASILNLLRDIQQRTGVAVLMITHNLAVVRLVCERVAVMYLGRIVETGATETVFADPEHPYTRLLLSSVPRLDRVPTSPRAAREPADAGTAWDAEDTRDAGGCRFAPRCPLAQQMCRDVDPVLAGPDDRHTSACHLSFGQQALGPENGGPP